MKGFQRLLFLFMSGFIWGNMPSLAEESEAYRFSASLYGGLYLTYDPAWLMEFDFKWHLHQYFGVGAALEMTSQYNQPSQSATIDGHPADLVENERNICWIIFKPRLIFRTPDFWHTADRHYRLWLEGVPGVSFACPFRNSLTYQILQFQGNVGHVIDYRRFANNGLQWFYWNATASLNLGIGRCIISGGWGISNLDYYSGRRNITFPDGSKPFVPKRELSQSVFLSIGCLF